MRSMNCVAALVSAVMLLWSGPLLAQAEQDKEALIARPVGIERLPKSSAYASATSDGDLLLVHEQPSQKTQPQSMTRIIAASTMFQLDPIIFTEQALSNLRLEYVAQSAEQVLWGVGAQQAIVKPLGQPWEAIDLGEPVDARACQARRHFDGPCQLVVPLGQGKAVVLRPTFEERQGQGRVLSTQVIALMAGQSEALAKVVLPNVVMGPAVQDGKGGFWVMIQRVQLGSNYKPMRGYLHYTSDGYWLLWSDSGESIDGTKFMGRAGFLIEPQSRKMAPDGNGGFLAIGKDRKLYRVDEQGKVGPFSAEQPSCLYCQPLSVAYDATTKDVHLVMAKWRGGEASDHRVEEPLRWMRFEQSGRLAQSELVPLTEEQQRRGLGLYASVGVLAGANNAWIVGPGLLMHRDRQEWSWLDEMDKVNAYLQRQFDAGKLAPDGTTIDDPEALKSPQLKLLGYSLSAGLTVGGLVGAYALADDDRSASLFYTWMLGSLATYYPASWFYPYVVDTGDPGQLRWTCLGAGFVGVPLVAAGTTWLVGESFEGQYNDSPFTGKSFMGALGGAAVGTLGSALLAKLIYSADPSTEEWIVATLGAMLVTSGATFGYVWGER